MKFYFDKYTIPLWVEAVAVLVFGVLFGCMFAYGF